MRQSKHLARRGSPSGRLEQGPGPPPGDHRRAAAHIAALAMAGLAGTLCAGPARASAVVPLSLPALADHAGQVFVGRVHAVHSYRNAERRRIETEVTFAEFDCLKGRVPDSGPLLTLIVPGGMAGGLTMRLAGAPEFQAGEKWLLFVLPEYRTHPVVGIWQGAFRVVADAAGVERVYDATGRPVTGLSADGFAARGATGGPDTRAQLVAATELRVLDSPRALSTAEAIALGDFVALLRPVLAASRDHQLSHAAGRPLMPDYRAVPLRAAERAQTVNESANGTPPPAKTGSAGRATRPPRAANAPRRAAGEGGAGPPARVDDAPEDGASPGAEGGR